jgi:hypothetical protein
MSVCLCLQRKVYHLLSQTPLKTSENSVVRNERGADNRERGKRGERREEDEKREERVTPSFPEPTINLFSNCEELLLILE